MNTWSSQPGYISWHGTTTNTPTSTGYGTGMQSVLAADPRFGTQLVQPLWDNNLYYRQNSAGAWTSWYKVWSTANFDPDECLERSVSNISAAGSADAFFNGYTFAYKSTGASWNGSLISYGGFGASYDTQISSDYGPDGGKHISFRTRNGDVPAHWNQWYELWNSGNLNRSDADFAAQTVNCTNVYAGGNLWAKEIRVAVNNPWADYVFTPKYVLRPLAEVRSFIQKNHRLPEMPSAQQVSKQGINLANIVTLQTKKIEELTLYLIEKDTKQQAQQKEIDELRKQVETLLQKKP
ncbi:hypothetical protein GCM10028826_17960 [Mucilaginibacter boryungensis]